MASQKELLSVAGKQEPMIPSHADVQDVGGPTLDWSTANYANFKFDAATGVNPDTTILPKAGVPAEPVHKMSEEDDDPSDAMDVTSEEMESEDEPKEDLPEEEDDAEKINVDEDDDEDDKDDENKAVLAELDGEDEDVLDLDLADLADDDTEMVELGDADVEEVTDEDEDELDFTAEEDEMSSDEADEDEMKKMPFSEAWKKMKEEDEDEEESDALMSEEDDDESDKKDEMMSEEEGDEDEDEDEMLAAEEDELKKAEDEMMSEGKIRVSLKFGDANKLFENNQTLTEEEKQQSRRLFEASVRAMAQDIGTQLHEAYSARYNTLKSLNERKLAHSKKVFEAKTAKQMDQYLSYVVEQWVKENRATVRTQLRNKLSENFINGLKDLFKKHYIEVPESRVNVVEALAKNVKALKQQVRESEARAVQLHAEMKTAVNRERQALVREHRARLIAEAASVLPAAERGQFAKRAESLTFANTKTFKKDLVALREQYAGAKTSGERPMNVPDAAPLFEQKQTSKTPVNAYIQAAQKFSR